MIIHYIFYFVYLAALSWCADRYHKNLKRVASFAMALKHPNAKKEIIWKEKDAATRKLEKDKTKSRLLFLIIGALHELAATFVTWNIIDIDNPDYNWLFPIPCVIISLLILQVIFWLKGKGGGIPHNEGIMRMPGGLH